MVKTVTNLLARLFGKRSTPRIQVIHRDPCRLTAEEWRSDPDLVRLAQKFLKDPEFRTMLDVCDRHNPSNQVLAANVSSEIRLVWHARGEGWTMFCATLESLGRLETPSEPLEPTFEPPEQPSEL